MSGDADDCRGDYLREMREEDKREGWSERAEEERQRAERLAWEREDAENEHRAALHHEYQIARKEQQERDWASGKELT